MANIKKISSTLSVAATVLLQACSSSDSSSGPAATPNTKAPELIGVWDSGCSIITTTNTFTAASGGSAGVSGTATINRATFNQDGNIELTSENFATTNCNANTSSGLRKFNAVYSIGGAATANDGSPVTEISYSTSSSTTYTIFQIINGITLQLGHQATSSTGKDGSSPETRLDGLGIDLDKD